MLARRSPVRALLPRDHPLAARDRLPLAELATEPLVFVPIGVGLLWNRQADVHAR